MQMILKVQTIAWHFLMPPPAVSQDDAAKVTATPQRGRQSVMTERWSMPLIVSPEHG